MKDLIEFLRKLYHTNAFTTFTEINLKSVDVLQALASDGVIATSITTDFDIYEEIKYQRVIQSADLDCTWVENIDSTSLDFFSHCILANDLTIEQALKYSDNCLCLYLLTTNVEPAQPLAKFDNYYLYQLK